MDKNKFQEIIARSQGILVVLPPNPNFDIVAAGLSVYLSLTDYGKKMGIFCSSPMLVEFNRLVGVDKVTEEIGGGNLTITLRDYPAQNIERVSYDIQGGLMQLVIIPKAQAPAPKPEQLSSSSGGISADTAVLIGKGMSELGEEMSSEVAKIPEQVVISQESPLVLGERRGVLELASPQASSLSEAVGWLLVEFNLPISSDIAGNILMGITLATGNFTSQNIRPETFELVAKMMRVRGGVLGAQPAVDSKEPSEEKPPEDWLAPKIYKGSTLP